MPQEQGHPGEGLQAGVALVFLDVGMGLQVGAEVGAVSKGPVAMCAGKRFLAYGDKSRREC